MGHVIRLTKDRSFYWTENGWGGYEGCEIYTDYERTIYNLPDEGEWVEIGQ